jgi:uncharacterized phage protein (TIGR02218 family)
MTFDADEKARSTGKPVECFRFATGAQVWLFTSADRDITLPVGVFLKETISSGEQSHSPEEISGDIQIHLPRTNPVAIPFIAYMPPEAMNVIRYEAHRGHESEYIVAFIGTVSGVRFVGSEAILTCSPIAKTFDRRIPGPCYQLQCNRALYSVGCRVSLSDFRDIVQVTTIEGDDLVSNDFALQPDGWYNGGFVKRANSEVRFVVAHIGNRVTLMSAFQTLASLEVVDIYAGCDRLESTCSTKFNNLLRFLGFSRVPTRNPHEGRIG